MSRVFNVLKNAEAVNFFVHFLYLEPDEGKFTCATINTLIDEDKVCDGIIDCKRDFSDEVAIGKLTGLSRCPVKNLFELKA